MRYLILLAVMGMGSTAAFADFQAFEPNRGDKEYSCRFRGAKKGLRCRAHIELSRDRRPSATELMNEKDARFHVECSDGFELFDRDARVDWERGTVAVKGRDGRDHAVVKIDLRNDVVATDLTEREDRYRARLHYEWNNVDYSLHGFCEREERNGRPRVESEEFDLM